MRNPDGQRGEVEAGFVGWGPLAAWLAPVSWRGRGAVPVRTSIDPPRHPEPRGHHLLTFWTYAPQRFGERLHIRFRSAEAHRRQRRRWRTLAAALWRMTRRHPGVEFHDIPVDLGDGDTPAIGPDVFRFARRPGQPHPLLPNLHLLERRSPPPAALPWEQKTDTLYFRGSCTGPADLARNKRLAACRAARTVPASDCRVTAFPEAPPEFVEQVRGEGLAAAFEPVACMNRHRFLLDVDGNTSSWDRPLLIGSFQAVPLRFEPEWEEIWHPLVREGVHHVTVTRTGLREVVSELRGDPDRAARIAAAAASVARDVLSPESLDRMLEQAWLGRLRAAA
jgi:hypothetical protein